MVSQACVPAPRCCDEMSEAELAEDTGHLPSKPGLLWLACGVAPGLSLPPGHRWPSALWANWASPAPGQRALLAPGSRSALLAREVHPEPVLAYATWLLLSQSACNMRQAVLGPHLLQPLLAHPPFLSFLASGGHSRQRQSAMLSPGVSPFVFSPQLCCDICPLMCIWGVHLRVERWV